MRKRLVSWFQKKTNNALSNPLVHQDLTRALVLLKQLPDSSEINSLASVEKLSQCQQFINTQVINLLQSVHDGRSSTTGEESSFRLDVLESSIKHKDSGLGVFVAKGKLRKGQVAAIYPGQIVLPLDFSRIIRNYESTEFKRLFGDDDLPNMHKILRFDQILLDARPLVFDFNEKIPKELEKSIEELRKKADKNPFAVGHLVNHPPLGTSPNLVICPYNFPRPQGNGEGTSESRNEDLDRDPFVSATSNLLSKIKIGQNTAIDSGSEELRLPDHLLPFVPHAYYKNKRPGYIDNTGMQQSIFKSDYKEIHSPSMVLIASRDVNEGEELFLNYRYSPKSNNIPDWYHSVDADEDLRRWS